MDRPLTPPLLVDMSTKKKKYICMNELDKNAWDKKDAKGAYKWGRKKKFLLKSTLVLQVSYDYDERLIVQLQRSQ